MLTKYTAKRRAFQRERYVHKNRRYTMKRGNDWAVCYSMSVNSREKVGR